MRTLPLPSLVLLLTACGGSDTPCEGGFGKQADGNCYQVVEEPEECEDGFGLAADGNCYPIDMGGGGGGGDTGGGGGGGDTGGGGGGGGGDTGGGGGGGGGDTGGGGGGGGGDTGGGGGGGDTGGGGGGGGGTAPCEGTEIPITGTLNVSRAPASGARCAVLAVEGTDPSAMPVGFLGVTCPTGTSASISGNICVGTATTVSFRAAVDEGGTINEADEAMNPWDVSSGTATGLEFNVTLR